MAFGPITSWQMEGENVERVTDFFFLGSKITADGDYSHTIKRHLLPGRKAMTNLDSVLKNWDFANKVHLVIASSSHVMDMRVGPLRKLSTEELMLLNCSVGEDSWESLGEQGYPTSQF